MMQAGRKFFWNVPGLGFVAAGVWGIAGCIMVLSIVGSSRAKACFAMARYAFAPFGSDLVSRRFIMGNDRLYVCATDRLFTAIWFPAIGLWLMLFHLFFAGIFTATLVGVPFARIHLKLAGAAIAPFDKILVDQAMAHEIDRRRARDRLAGFGERRAV